MSGFVANDSANTRRHDSGSVHDELGAPQVRRTSRGHGELRSMSNLFQVNEAGHP